MHIANLTDLFERLPDGAVLLDDAGRFVSANSVARAMLEAEDGLSLREGRLLAADENDTWHLRKLAAAASAPIEHALADGHLSLPRPSGRPPYHVFVAALRGSDAWAGGVAQAAVYVRDPERRSPRATAYGLTPMERRLALPLLSGLSLEDAQRASGVCWRSVRRVLAEVFAMTNWALRNQLVRQLLSLPPELP